MKSYDATLHLPDGSPWLDYPCELDACLEWENGEPSVSVSDVQADISSWREPSRFISMLGPSADPLMAQIGRAIQEQAENDDELLSSLLSEEGAYWDRLPNDPDGRWRAA